MTDTEKCEFCARNVDHIKKDAYSKHTLLRALVTAACGGHAYISAPTERESAHDLNECVDELKAMDIDETMWSARRVAGNRNIQFKNGGEVRFVSFRSPAWREW